MNNLKGDESKIELNSKQGNKFGIWDKKGKAGDGEECKRLSATAHESVPTQASTPALHEGSICKQITANNPY